MADIRVKIEGTQKESQFKSAEKWTRETLKGALTDEHGAGVLKDETGTVLKITHDVVQPGRYRYAVGPQARAPGIFRGLYPFQPSDSAMVHMWEPYQHLTKTLHTVQLLAVDGTAFGDWYTPARQEAFCSIFADREVCLCTSEAPPIPAEYRMHGELARDMAILVIVLDSQPSDVMVSSARAAYAAASTQLSQLHVLTHEEIMVETMPSAGFKKPDWALMFRSEVRRAVKPSYRELLQFGELVVVDRDGTNEPTTGVLTAKLAQSFDHVARFDQDQPGASVAGCLPFEVGDGRWSKPSLVDLTAPRGRTDPPAWYTTSAWQRQLGEVTRKAITLGDGWDDKVCLAFHAGKRAKQLLQAAGERPDKGLHSSAQLSLTRVVVLEEQSSLGSTSSTQGEAGSPEQPALPVPLRQHPLLLAQQLNAASAGSRMFSAAAEAGPLAGKKLVVRLQQPAQCGKFFDFTASMQQVDRESLAGQQLAGAGWPYLPRLLVSGHVEGSQEQTAAVLTECGKPLQHYCDWTRGQTLARLPSLLLIAHGAAACLALRVAHVHHNDLRPENITVSWQGSSAAELMFHFVDLGFAACSSLDSPGFLQKWGFTQSVSLTCPLSDLWFGALETLQRSANTLRDLSDAQALCYTVLYLTAGYLPWAAAAERKDVEGAMAGRLEAMRLGASWRPLRHLHPAAARFVAWVLTNAQTAEMPASVLEQQVEQLFTAVQQETGQRPLWPSAAMPTTPTSVLPGEVIWRATSAG